MLFRSIVALLAFILGDFLTSGRTYFGSGTTVAEAAGAQVDYTAYQNRLSQLSEQYQAQGRQFDNDRMSQNVIQELLVEQLLEKEYDRLGITVTDAELTTAMTGDMPHPAAARFISATNSYFLLLSKQYINKGILLLKTGKISESFASS